MKELAEVMAVAVLLLFTLLLFFLFDGKPDIWDLLHTHAMERLKP